MLRPARAYSSRRNGAMHARTEAGPAPSPALGPPAAPSVEPGQFVQEGDAERLARLKRLQFESLTRHAARLPLLIPLVAGLVGFIVWNSVPGALVVGWIVALTLVLTARWRYSSRAVLRSDLDLDAALRTMVALSFCNGLIQGAGIALFFPGITLEQKAIVTMIMVCLSAGAVSANAGYSRSFYAWAIPMFAALCLAWALTGDVVGTWIGVLLALFPIAEAVFVRDNERVLRESFEIRYQNEKLIRELELQRQAVAHERDRAEEANRAKSRFLASASHDLRQPLHTLSLYSAALGMRKTDERTQAMAREIAAAIGSLGSLLDALLDISKLDADAVRPEPDRFALGSLLERIAADFRPIATAKGLSLEVETRGLLVVYTDVVLLERIARNLLDNAIKYTSRGTVRLKGEQVADRAVLTVSDTGPGIPRAEHERVFEEFYQLSNPERDRSRGIGLGLAIVRRLTNLLGIELKFDSELGRGTMFRLSLPLAEHRAVAAAEAMLVAEPQDVALPPRLRVLVIDDERSVREGMRTLLESWGCVVTLASDIAEALGALSATGSDLIIVDQRLRGSETGAELVRRARAIAYAVPALLITGDTAAGLLLEAKQLGLTLLHKPVGERTLRRAIASAVGREMQ